jgi:hypothetical protein
VSSVPSRLGQRKPPSTLTFHTRQPNFLRKK